MPRGRSRRRRAGARWLRVAAAAGRESRQRAEGRGEVRTGRSGERLESLGLCGMVTMLGAAPAVSVGSCHSSLPPCTACHPSLSEPAALAAEAEAAAAAATATAAAAASQSLARNQVRLASAGTTSGTLRMHSWAPLGARSLHSCQLLFTSRPSLAAMKCHYSRASTAISPSLPWLHADLGILHACRPESGPAPPQAWTWPLSWTRW